MGSKLNDRVGRWVALTGVDPSLAPNSAALSTRFRDHPDPCRPGAPPREIDAWERRHGYQLPTALRAWLELSNGFYLRGPLIHPLFAIGPMVPFARVPELLVQPESWFELGNPNVETVCMDLAYQWPDAGSPIFTSGDDLTGSSPILVASSFESWFLQLLCKGGREFWFEPGFVPLGDPWQAHKRHAPAPLLPDRLRPLVPHILPMIRPGADDRLIASSLGISRGDVETILRHLQHNSQGFAEL